MGSLETTHERSTIGQTRVLTATSSAQRLTLNSTPSGTGPSKYILLADGGDIYLRQGASDGTDVSTDSYKLKNGTTHVIVATSLLDNTLSYLRVGSTNVTVRLTEISSLTPGSGADATA